MTNNLSAGATGAGTAARVKLFRAGGMLRFSVTPLGASYTGGLRIATGDGVADVVVGPTGGPRMTEVRVIDGRILALSVCGGLLPPEGREREGGPLGIAASEPR